MCFCGLTVVRMIAKNSRKKYQVKRHACHSISEVRSNVLKYSFDMNLYVNRNTVVLRQKHHQSHVRWTKCVLCPGLLLYLMTLTDPCLLGSVLFRQRQNSRFSTSAEHFLLHSWEEVVTPTCDSYQIIIIMPKIFFNITRTKFVCGL